MAQAGAFKRLFRLARGLFLWPFAPFFKYLPDITASTTRPPRDGTTPASEKAKHVATPRKSPREFRPAVKTKPVPAQRHQDIDIKAAKGKTRATPRQPSRDTPGRSR